MREKIDTLKSSPLYLLLPGKVEVLNFVNKEISNNRIMVLKPETVVILVYDTDCSNDNILRKNLEKLLKNGIKKIIHIQSIRNFEDEIVISTKIKNINEVYGTKSKEEFKRRFLNQNDLYAKLKGLEFDVVKMWSRKNDDGVFSKYSNDYDLMFIKSKK